MGVGPQYHYPRAALEQEGDSRIQEFENPWQELGFCVSGSLWVRREISLGDTFSGSLLFFCPQSSVASTLGVPINRILARVKRIGGGFGGKETRGIGLTVAVALAAYK